jgi:hypothetical protein
MSTNLSLEERMTMNHSQNYWAFGLRPSSGILETRKRNILETESVLVIR